MAWAGCACHVISHERMNIMPNEKTIQTQLAIIGGGPGGYAAAFHAAELGMQVTMINSDERPGGVCLHRGCIPSKALLHIARVINESREIGEFGVHFTKPEINVDVLRDWKNGVVNRMASGLVELGNRRNVRMIRAFARFADSATLRLEAVADAPLDVQFVEFEHAIVATGSKPAIPGVFRLDDERVMDSTSALNLDQIPGSLLVIGGGYIGLEMGTFYAALGSQVSVVELTNGLLPGADRDLVRPLQTRIEKQFEKIWLSTEVLGMESRDEGIAVRMRGQNAPEEQVFDRVLVSVGRWPNSAGIGLEDTRVETDEKGFVRIDAQQRTDDPRIYAIGDVAGEPMLAHKASREAKVAVEAILGHKSQFDNAAIPAVVFTDPELAWCGLTETQARAEKRTVEVARFPWGASGRAQTIGRPEGLTKIIFDPETERVLGVGLVGAGAGELIAEGVLAVEMACVARDIAESIHPHPTLSETVMESAEAFFGQATHLYRPKR